jgi:hypothetical protein
MGRGDQPFEIIYNLINAINHFLIQSIKDTFAGITHIRCDTKDHIQK